MYDQGRDVLGLKEALCGLPTFQTTSGRHALLSALRSSGIDIDPDLDGGARQAVSTFVDLCLDHPNALHHLKRHVRYFEGVSSNSAAKAVRAIENLLPSEWFETIAERAAYLADLEKQLSPDELAHYLPAADRSLPAIPAPLSVDDVVRALESMPVSEASHPILVLTVHAGRSAGHGSASLREWAETLANRMGLPGASGAIAEAERRAAAARSGRSRYRDPRPAPGGLRILAVGTEWASAHGGISTFNRQLCTVLAHLGAHISCLVTEPTGDEIADADDCGVRLVTAPQDAPDLVIGHGWITGVSARDLAASFREARRVHFYHMASEENEWQKTDRRDDAGSRALVRRTLEISLGEDATVAAAVGPRLYERFSTDLAARPGARLVRFDPGFDFVEPAQRNAPPGSPWRILIFGRTDDVLLKGLDIAAKAVARTHRHRGERATAVELVVRGAVDGTSERLRDRLREYSGLPELRIVVRPYTPAAADIMADLKEASLVMLPSRTEGFGFSGLEAIITGTPLLVSGESGLGMLLNEVLPPEQAQRSVVRVSHDEETDIDNWDRAIWATLRDRDASFARAAELHRTMAVERTWHDAVTSLLQHVGSRV